MLDTRDQRAVASHNAASALPYVKSTRAGNLNKGTYSEQDIKDIVQLHENSRKLLSKKSELTRDQKSVVQAALTKDVSCKAAQQITGVGARRVRQIKQDAEIMFNTDGPSITEDEDNLKSDNALLGVIIENMYVGFMVSITGVLSGAKSDTLTLAMPKHTAMATLFGRFPDLLRKLSKSNKNLMDLVTVGTRLHRAIEASLKAEAREGFDAEAEVKHRTQIAEFIYRKELDKKQRKGCIILPSAVKVKQGPRESNKGEVAFTQEEIANAQGIMPIGDHAFWRLLKRKKIKYTTNPNLAAALAKVAELRRSLVMDPIRAVDLKGDDEKRDRDVQASAAEMKKLRTTIAKLTTLCAKYRLHKEQYEKCREEVEKLEARLLPGVCLLFRDFVAQYTANGSKMSNLQLVCLYRNVKDGPLFQFQVSNFSLTQSQDKYYVADVMDFHMKAKEDGGSGLLSKFTTV